MLFRSLQGMQIPEISHIRRHDFPLSDEEAQKWTVCGSLCTTGDILVRNVELRNPEIGDVLVFGRTGAYSVTEGIALFLSRELPAVVLIREDGVPVCIRGITPTDPFNTPAYQMEVR